MKSILPGLELPHTVDAAQRAFDDELARTLEAIADRIEGRPSQVGLLEEWLSCLNVRSVLTRDENRNQRRRIEFLSLHRRIENLASSLQKEVGNAEATRRACHRLLVADAFPNNSVAVRRRVQRGSGGIAVHAQRVQVHRPFPEPISVLSRFLLRSGRICWRGWRPFFTSV